MTQELVLLQILIREQTKALRRSKEVTIKEESHLLVKGLTRCLRTIEERIILVIALSVIHKAKLLVLTRAIQLVKIISILEASHIEKKRMKS